MAESARTRRSYDQVADRYAAELSTELDHKPVDRALLTAFAELAAGGTVLDVGCGPAHVAHFLARCGVRPIGIDLSPGMAAAARRATSLPVLAADMTALPVRSHSVDGIVCLYAVIHLETAQRRAAYREFARVLRPPGHAVIAFHTSDADVPVGGHKTLTEWWGHDVDLTFHYLDPAAETAALADAGLALVARLDRAPIAGLEHPSERSYLTVRRASDG